MAERTEATFDAREAGLSHEKREMAIAAIRGALKRVRAPGHFHHHWPAPELSAVQRRRGSAVLAATSCDRRGPGPSCRHWVGSEMGDSDDQLRDLLDRGYELAASRLEGINEAALELADAVGDDRRVMERAFRVVAERVRVEPSHANKQVASLIRRAIELGMWRWDWDDTRQVP